MKVSTRLLRSLEVSGMDALRDEMRRKSLTDPSSQFARLFQDYLSTHGEPDSVVVQKFYVALAEFKRHLH